MYTPLRSLALSDSLKPLLPIAAFLFGLASLLTESRAAVTPATLALGQGLKLTPEIAEQKGESCGEKTESYRLSGSKDANAQKRVNSLLRDAVEISEGCDSIEENTDDLLPFSFEREIKDAKKIEDALVFRVLETSYTGGVHSSYHYAAQAINLKTGEKIDVDTLFSVNGHQALNELGRQKLKQYYLSADAGADAASDSPNASGSKSTRDAPPTLSIRTDQILPLGKGFEVKFNPYEVDCFAAGAPVITFTAGEAARVFKQSALNRALFGLRPL